jgi:predicted MFS family arabinose efflux permease
MRFANLIFIFLLSIPSGMFLLLSGSTLSFWLRDNQFDKVSIGLFSLANILHIFKFMWGPYLEDFSFIKQYQHGFKISIAASLLGCIICIYFLALTSPNNILVFSIILVIFSLFSATYEMLLQASQMLIIDKKTWGYSEAFCVTGFRIGILFSGSLSIYLSTIISWQEIYQIMGSICLGIFLIALWYPFKFITLTQSSSHHNYTLPFKDFLSQPNLLYLVAFLFTYRLPDSILGKMPNLFLLEIGFSKISIALVYKAFGLMATLIGGIMGGYLCRKLPYKKIFPLVVIPHAISTLSFLLLLSFKSEVKILCFVVLIHELTKGFMITPFFSYQLRCCNPAYRITHIAIITSITECSRIVFGSFSGILAHYLGWGLFFIIASLSFAVCLPLINRVPEYK